MMNPNKIINKILYKGSAMPKLGKDMKSRNNMGNVSDYSIGTVKYGWKLMENDSNHEMWTYYRYYLRVEKKNNGYYFEIYDCGVDGCDYAVNPKNVGMDKQQKDKIIFQYMSKYANKPISKVSRSDFVDRGHKKPYTFKKWSK